MQWMGPINALLYRNTNLVFLKTGRTVAPVAWRRGGAGGAKALTGAVMR